MSDHCALIMKNVEVDWGPRPFRTLDVWQQDVRFKDFIRSKWNSYDLSGFGLITLKEKLKRLKSNIKI